MTTAVQSQAKSQPFPYFFNEDHLDYQRVRQILRSISGVLPPFAEDVLCFIADTTTRFGRTYARIKPKNFSEGYNGSTNGFGGTMPPAPHSEKTRYKTLALLERLGLISRDGEIYTINLNNINPVDLLNDEEIIKGFMHRNKHNPDLRTMEGVAKWAAQRLYSILKMISGMGYSPVDGNSKFSQKNASKKMDNQTKQDITSQTYSKCPQTAMHSSSQERKTYHLSNAPCDSIQETGNGFLSLISSILQENNDLPYSFLSIIDIIYPDKSGYNWCSELLRKIMGNRTPQEIASDALASANSKRNKVHDKQAKRGTLADRMRAFERAWGDGQRETSKGIPTRIDPASKRLVKEQVLKQSDPTFDCSDFAKWVAQHWQAIGAQYFSKFKVYPEKPAIRWFLKFTDTYIEAYEQKDFLDETGTLSVRDAGKAIKRSKNTVKAAARVIQHKDAQIEDLEARLREAEQHLEHYEKGGNAIESDMISPRMKKILKGVKKRKSVDYDDE